MKINLKKMLPYFEDEELMEIYEKIAESPDGEFEGVTVCVGRGLSQAD